MNFLSLVVGAIAMLVAEIIGIFVYAVVKAIKQIRSGPDSQMATKESIVVKLGQED